MTNEERDKLINSVLPDTVKGQQRPAENLNPDMPYSTDFPQLINKDPASADVFNLINRQLLSNDKSLNDSKADKTYVDKKVADLVNGAPEQLDTLQELSKALNNDKDYAATVNNALAEKLGKTEKAVSAETADDSDKLDGHHYQDIINKIPSRSNLPLQYEQKKDETNQKNYNYIYPDNGFSGGSPDAATRIELYGRMGYWNADGANLTLTGADDSNGFLFRLSPMSQRVDDSPAVIPELVGSIDYSTSAYKYSNPKLTWTDDKGVIADLAGAGIVSQQLGQEMNYIKYANGLLVQFGMMEVQGYSGTKMYVKTLPISFKATYSLQATLGYPNTDRVSSVQAETDLTYIKLYVHNFINDHNAPVYYCHWLMIGSWK